MNTTPTSNVETMRASLTVVVDAKVEEIFRVADNDNDGNISHAEFLWAMTGLDFHTLGTYCTVLYCTVPYICSHIHPYTHIPIHDWSRLPHPRYVLYCTTCTTYTTCTHSLCLISYVYCLTTPFTPTPTHTHIHTYIHTHTHTHIHTHTYTHIHTHKPMHLGDDFHIPKSGFSAADTFKYGSQHLTYNLDDEDVWTDGHISNTGMAPMSPKKAKYGLLGQSPPPDTPDNRPPITSMNSINSTHMTSNTSVHKKKGRVLGAGAGARSRAGVGAGESNKALVVSKMVSPLHTHTHNTHTTHTTHNTYIDTEDRDMPELPAFMAPLVQKSFKYEDSNDTGISSTRGKHRIIALPPSRYVLCPSDPLILSSSDPLIL
jgi:hypothetical protein